MNEEDSDAFEQEPTGLYASVKIENLTKVCTDILNYKSNIIDFKYCIFVFI